MQKTLLLLEKLVSEYQPMTNKMELPIRMGFIKLTPIVMGRKNLK